MGKIAVRIALVIFLLLLAASAAGRDPDGRYANSPMKPWFDSLHSGKGPCCSDADGTVVKDADWESVNDPKKPAVHYRVRLEGNWVDVPDDAVLTQPNLYGRTMVWPIYYRSSYGDTTTHIQIRCFIVGPEG